MATGDIIKLGTLYVNNVKQVRPMSPWENGKIPTGAPNTGNIPSYTSGNIEIRDTDSADTYVMQWVEVKDGTKRLLIGDRVALAYVHWDKLNELGLIFGIVVTIDNKRYKLRAMSGGSNYRYGSNQYSGGQPANNEWDMYVVNEAGLLGLPTPATADLDNKQTEADYNSAHNAMWNWYGIFSWCQEMYTEGTSAYRAVRGHQSANSWGAIDSSSRHTSRGWRPLLEPLNSAPLISDTDRNLGDRSADFDISYYVDDDDVGDIITVTEKLDGIPQKTFTAARKQNYTVNVPVSALSLGTHTVQVSVTDGQDETIRTWTFQRTNAVPSISGSDGSLGDKNLGFRIEYIVSDTDGDALTVTEKLNGETLRVINSAPHGQALTLEVSDTKLHSLSIDSVNTIQIMASDGRGGVAYRTYTFKRTNTAPFISGADKGLGLQTGGFAEEYAVTDVEGDIIIVTEYIDDDVIRSYEATQGNTEEIMLTRDKWLVLSNGQHVLKVEAVDSGNNKAVRVFSFSKDENEIDVFPFPEPCKTDEAASKILFTPAWCIDGSEFDVYACNNAFDTLPAWEKITPQVLLNRVYNFINSEKTAEDWGVDVRVCIKKNDGYDGIIYIGGYGGAFE